LAETETSTVSISGDENTAETITLAGANTDFANKVSVANDAANKIFFFNINDELAENDWCGDDVNPQFLQLQMVVLIPRNNDIHYYTWSDGVNTTPIQSARTQNGSNIRRDVGWGTVVRPAQIQGRDFVINHTFTWLGSDQETVIDTTQFITVVRYMGYPVDLPAVRINAPASDTISNGQVMYAAGESSVITEVSALDNFVTQYSINGGERKEISDGKIAIETAGSTDTLYKIKWYTPVGKVAATEKLQVSFITYATEFEPIPAEWINVDGLEGVEGISCTLPTDASNNINDTIVFNCDVDAENWNNALLQLWDTQSVHWPIVITLPENAVQTNFYATGYTPSDEGLLDSLAAIRYVPVDGDYTLWPEIRIANVVYDGNNAIISPVNPYNSFLFKWIDDENVEHFHKLDVKGIHKSEKSVKILAACPSESRLGLNDPDPLEGVTSSFTDGTVSYHLTEEQAADSTIITTVEFPSDPAIVKVNITFPSGKVEYREASEGLPVFLPVSAQVQNTYGMTINKFQLEWLDQDGNVVKRESLMITVHEAFKGIWLDDYWAPITEERVGIFDGEGIEKHFTYDNGRWTFKVDPAEMEDLDFERLSEYEQYFYIIPPEGAVAFKSTLWTRSLYSETTAEETRAILDAEDVTPIKGATDGLFRYVEKDGKGYLAFYFGDVFYKTELEGTDLTIYAVNESSVGFAETMIIEWYREDGNGDLEHMTAADGTDGEFIYMIKEPYLVETKTELLEQEPTGTIDKPYAKVKKGPKEWKGKTLYCEIPMQKQDDGKIVYSYMKLALYDADGNEILLPEGTEIEVFIPFPEKINSTNEGRYKYSVIHYADDTHEESEELKINFVPGQGYLSFTTTSFSPFLLKCEPIDTAENAAYNETTGKSYAAIEEAMLDAEPGETVQLLQDAKGSVIWVFEEITLDLNGYTLTADYVSSYGDIIDSSADNSGRVAVPDAKRVMIQPDNAQLPIRDAEGAYAFVEVLKFNKALLTSDTGAPKYVFQPVFEEAAHELLKTGTASSGVSITVNVSWSQANGSRKQVFTYNDGFVKAFLDSYNSTTGKYGQMFSLTLKSTDVEDLQFNAAVTFDDKVSFSAPNVE